RFDLAAAVSYGLTGDASLTPRFRFAHGHVAVSLGAGVSLVYDKGELGESSRWYGQALADLELTYTTDDHWVLQGRIGAALARHDGPQMDVAPWPYAGI